MESSSANWETICWRLVAVRDASDIFFRATASPLPAEVALDIMSRNYAKELGRLEVTCRGARGGAGLVELAVLRVERDYAIPIPTTRENWPQVVQRGPQTG